jgi:hypothetical protein
MILLTVNEMKSEIDSDIVNKVIRLMDWQLAVRKIHDPIDADNKLAEMEQKIRKILSTGPKTGRRLKQLVNANRAGLWVFNTSLGNLTNAKEIQVDKATKQWKIHESVVKSVVTT